MKKMPLLLLFLSLMVLSCKKDEMILHEETKTEPTLSIQEAQNSFNPEKFTTSLDGSSNCNLLPKMQITPEWSKSKQYQFAKYSVVETPLLWNNQKLGKLRQVDSKTDRGKKKAEEVEIVTNLISVKDSTGKITRKIMVISGEPDYLKNNKITNNNYKQKDPKFTGEVIYYNEDGSFNSGWRFKNGRVVKKIMNIICDDNSVGLRNYEYRCDLIRECTHWFQIGYGGEVSYLGSSCSYTTECDWYPISEDQNPEEDGTSGGVNYDLGTGWEIEESVKGLCPNSLIVQKVGEHYYVKISNFRAQFHHPRTNTWINISFPNLCLSSNGRTFIFNELMTETEMKKAFANVIEAARLGIFAQLNSGVVPFQATVVEQFKAALLFNLNVTFSGWPSLNTTDCPGVTPSPVLWNCN